MWWKQGEIDRLNVFSQAIRMTQYEKQTEEEELGNRKVNDK